MPKIFKYQKTTDQYTTHALIEPDYELLETNSRIIELCNLGNETYVSVPDDIALPEQPEQIVLSEVILDKALYESIESVSSHVQLINRRIADKVLTMSEGNAQKRALGYIPGDLETIFEKMVKAEDDMEVSIWWQKTDAELNTYINNNWNDPDKRKSMFKKLVKQVVDMARREGWNG